MLTFPDIVSSHLSRKSARDAARDGQRVIRAGTFADGSFGLYKPERVRADGTIIPYVGRPLITVWHVVKR